VALTSSPARRRAGLGGLARGGLVAL